MVSATQTTSRTIWGLDPLQLHQRYWAAHGVQVVRRGEPSEIVRHAELFLLSEPRMFTLFQMTDVMEVLNWVKPRLLCVRLHDTRERRYREQVIADEHDRFQRFQRLYDAADTRSARIVLTPEREIAKLWQSSPDTLTGWRRMRRFTPRLERVTSSVDGHVYDNAVDHETAEFLRELMAIWKRPDATIARARRGHGQVWKDAECEIDNNAKLIGPVWIGRGRRLDGSMTVIGPAVVWDDPRTVPSPEAIHWLDIEPLETPPEASPRHLPPLGRAFKRLFDFTFSLAAILISLPLYPFILLAILFEDGRPFFFAHRRETIGGREFPCIKFRSMRKDAEKIKAQLKTVNQADGPQFFMENDPRLTKVGKFLRKYHLDELPQFINVLMGDMSIVGPRPSPRVENQYCPPWREARLSVRPGITGLWQIKRTREAGTDFQEWIKYDIEYVETMNWRLDLAIIWRTISMILRKAMHS